MHPLLTDRHIELREKVAAFGRERIAPVAADLDERCEFPWENVKTMAEMGLLGVPVPKELGGLDSTEYREALETARRLSRAEGIDALMQEHELDAIVAPTTRAAWKTDLVNGDMSSAGASSPAAVAGYPSITVPNGYVHGLPVGILFFGRAWSGGTLLRLAYAYEQSTHHRAPARLLPTIDLANA